MQTPVRIEFQGMDPSDVLRGEIAGHASRLEDRFGRLTSCRVVIKGPGEHHREGGLYEVNIGLSLPNGKEVNVDRTPGADERHADVHFAINDAFKPARRRLQDHARRLDRQVKTHAPEPAGTVTLDDGFGFLQTRDAGRSTSKGTARLRAGFPGCRLETRDLCRGSRREAVRTHRQAARHARHASVEHFQEEWKPVFRPK